MAVLNPARSTLRRVAKLAAVASLDRHEPPTPRRARTKPEETTGDCMRCRVCAIAPPGTASRSNAPPLPRVHDVSTTLAWRRSRAAIVLNRLPAACEARSVYFVLARQHEGAASLAAGMQRRMRLVHRAQRDGHQLPRSRSSHINTLSTQSAWLERLALRRPSTGVPVQVSVRIDSVYALPTGRNPSTHGIRESSH